MDSLIVASHINGSAKWNCQFQAEFHINACTLTPQQKMSSEYIRLVTLAGSTENSAATYCIVNAAHGHFRRREALNTTDKVMCMTVAERVLIVGLEVRSILKSMYYSADLLLELYCM